MNKMCSLLVGCALTISSAFAADVGNTQENAYVASRNSFSFALVNALGAPQDNICISPYNISSALELAYFGADGGTKSEISATLNLPMMNDQALADEIKKADAAFGASVTNARALAVDTAFLPTDHYLQMVKENLGADAFEVNFKKKPQEAADSINNWAAKMTQGRISKLLEPSNINDATKLVLLSSIYIKSAWLEPFQVNNTANASFKTLGGSDISVPMMQQTKNMNLFQDASVQVVWRDLALKNSTDARLEVLFVVPQNADALKTVSQALSSDQLDSWQKQAQNQYVQLFVPRCSVRQRLSVKKPLQDLGMKQAFSMAADFSVISPKSDLMISDVLHAAFMQLNEAGIEAAAATAVVMVTKSATINTKTPVVVRCDKPFYTIIREKTSGLVLFVSLIASPQSVE